MDSHSRPGHLLRFVGDDALPAEANVGAGDLATPYEFEREESPVPARRHSHCQLFGIIAARRLLVIANLVPMTARAMPRK